MFKKNAFYFLLLFVSPVLQASTHIPAASLRLNPLSVLVGGLSTALDFELGQHWTLGPSFSFFQSHIDSGNLFLADYAVKSYGLGLRGTWFERGLHETGFYVAPVLVRSTSTVVTKDLFGPVSGQASAVFLGFFGGRAWVWQRWSLLLGVGYRRPIAQQKVKITSSFDRQIEVFRDKGDLSAELFLGWQI